MSAHNIEALSTAVDPKPVRRRSSFKRVPMEGEPTVRHGTVNGSDVVFVSLFGGLGIGREMTLDAEVWSDIVASFGSRWVLNRDGKGNAYVKSGAVNAAAVADQPGSNAPTACLARLITGARKGDRVWFKNKNTLDLRLANLSVARCEETGSGALGPSDIRTICH